MLVPDAEQPTVVLDRFELLADSTFALDIAQVATARAFNPVAGADLQFPAGAVYWLRFSVTNDHAEERRAYLRLRTSDFYNVVLYTRHATEGTFTSYPRAANERIAVFPLDVRPAEPVEIYLLLDRRYIDVTCILELMNTTALYNSQRRSAFEGGVYAGVGLLYLLLAVVIMVLLRTIESRYYAVYVLGGLSYLLYSRAPVLPALMNKLGVGFLFDTLPYLACGLLVFSLLGLFATFFRLERGSSNWWVCRGLQVALITLSALLAGWPLLVEIWFYAYLYVVFGVALCSLLAILFICFVGVRLMRRGLHYDQLYFTITFAPVLLLLVYMWLSEMQLLPRFAVVFDNGPGILFLYEGAALGAILVYRYFRERTHLLDRLENERREIIHDLHSGLLPEVDALRELNQRSILPVSVRLHERVSALSDDINEDVRLLMWTLNRQQGEDLDELVGRLRQKVSSRFASLPARAVFATEPTLIPGNIPVRFTLNYHLLHFFKEAVNNVAKHANCTRLDCRVVLNGQNLELTIADDGCGFVYNAENTTAGFGLGKLRQRAEKMGARFSCVSRLGEGTTIGLVVPFGQR